jgi:hypothetical protein
VFHLTKDFAYKGSTYIINYGKWPFSYGSALRTYERQQVMLQIEQTCILRMRNNILSNVTLDIRIQKNFMLQIIKTHTQPIRTVSSSEIY